MKFIKRERSTLVIASVYLVVFIMAIITSIFNVGLDLTQIGTNRFLGNLALNYAIAIIVVMAAMRDSENRELLKAYYINATEELLNILSQIKIRKLDTVFKYYTKFRFKQQRQEYIDGKLFQAGISKELYNLDEKQLKKLLEDESISKDRYNLIMALKHGKFKFKEIRAEEIMNDYDKTLSYQQMRSNRSQIIASKVGPRFITLLASSIVFTAAIINNSTGSTEQILTDLITRLANIVTAIFAGYFVGPELVNDRTKMKKLKKTFCHEFIADFDSGAYAPSQEEMTDEVIEKIKSYVILPPDIEEEVTIDVAEFEEFKKYKEGKTHDKGKQEP